MLIIKQFSTKVILLSFVFSFLFVAGAFSQPAIDKNNMDLSVKPGDDFFSYVNGTWNKNNPIPPDMGRYGAFDELIENNRKQINSLIEEASSKPVKGTNKQKIGDFYLSGMDEVKIDALGYEPIKSDLDKIKSLSTKSDLIKFTAYLHSYGIYPIFYAGGTIDDKNSNYVITLLYQSGLGLPDKNYYFKEDERSKAVREEYLKQIGRMLNLIGNDESTANNKAKIIYDIELKLAEIAYTKTDLQEPSKNYNKMNLQELITLSGGFDWTLYFKEFGLSEPGDINVAQKPYFEGLGKIFEQVSLDDWKYYFEWVLLRNNANLLSSNIVEQNFEFSGKFMTGAKEMRPRWKRVTDVISGSLGDVLGELYVEKYFPPTSKKRVIELVENLRLALKDRIQRLAWMSDVTKQNAIEKLEKINVKIGYPDKWKDYYSLEIDRNIYFENIQKSRHLEFLRNIKKIGKPVDKTEWGMTPQTVNAYYNPKRNEIVFPAGILQPPFFWADADDAVNYGGIGVVIGHETSHGFDNHGRQFDKDGNMTDWWTEEDAKNFDNQTQVLVDQFNNYKMLDTLHVDGKMTLGENIADLGGVSISLEALKKAWEKNPPQKEIDGFTPLQRFFLSFGQIWKGSIRDKELMRRLREDEHSPSEARVNGTVYNVPEFYEAFKIQPTDKRYTAPENRALVW
ncbi:MAG: M13 family metallopeptidase [Ignavibacteriae bacterium]|nr:M13 family metallopeptidase [Ignavibacteriota bacterium]